MIGREGPGPERPGPDYPPEWDREPEEDDRSPEEAVEAANDGPGPDGHHRLTGECFACLVGVATGPESHGDRCPLGGSRTAWGPPPGPDPWSSQGPVPPPPF